MTAALFTPTVEYDGLALRETPYRLRDDGLAEIPDDGIVDEVAVDRTIHGRRPARLTPREVICIVHRAARNGRSDAYISALLRAGTPEAITAIRIRHDIPSTVTP